MLTIIDNALNSITRMLMPVSPLALLAKLSSARCSFSPAAGTKLLNTNDNNMSRAGANTGNTENIANTATISGTSETSVV